MLTGWTRASPGAALATVGLALFAGTLPVIAALLTKTLIDHLSSGAPLAAEMPITFGVAACTFAAAVSPYVGRLVQNHLTRSVELHMQGRMFEAIHRVPTLNLLEEPDFRDHLELAGDAASRGPAEGVNAIATLSHASLASVGFLSTLILIDWRLAALALAATTPGLVAEAKLARARAALMWELSTLDRRRFFFNSVQLDACAAKEIRVFGLGGYLNQRMLVELSRMTRAEQRRDRRELGVQAVLGAVSASLLSVGLILTVREATAGRLSLGDVSVVLIAFAALQTASAGAIRNIGELHDVLTLHGHFDHVLATCRSSAGRAGRRRAHPLHQGLELRDVWFRYGEDHPWVLRGASLRIASHSTVALVGLNGAGKSTVVKLLCGLLEPQRGAVLWDGVDLRELDPRSVRERITVAFQDYMAWELTARENIAFGDLPRLTDEEAIRQAARLAGIDATLRQLPRAYDTLLTRMLFAEEPDDRPDLGVVLSGGQWQRLALARAFMRSRCDLIVLDEPTSGLDAEAEHRLQQEFRDMARGRTAVLISHRLSSVRRADQIVVLGEGRVVERGTHDELVAENGAYSRLFALQATGYSDGPDLTRRVATPSTTASATGPQ